MMYNEPIGLNLSLVSPDPQLSELVLHIDHFVSELLINTALVLYHLASLMLAFSH